MYLMRLLLFCTACRNYHMSYYFCCMHMGHHSHHIQAPSLMYVNCGHCYMSAAPIAVQAVVVVYAGVNHMVLILCDIIIKIKNSYSRQKS